MAVYTDAIQKLYVAYFNRPADYEGLAFWEGVLNRTNGDLSLVSSTFAKSTEYQAQVAGKSYYQIVNQIYNNLFNRDALTSPVWNSGLANCATTSSPSIRSSRSSPTTLRTPMQKTRPPTRTRLLLLPHSALN